MTYAEIFDWLDDTYPEIEYGEDIDLGEMYEVIESEWTGRNNFSDIISIDEFINNYGKWLLMEYVTKYKVISITSLLTIVGLVIDKLLGCGVQWAIYLKSQN